MSDRLVVFVGPSLERDEVRRALPDARVEPPAARGDLDRLRAQGATAFLLLDGVFAHRLAVSPSEIIRALHAGARVVGAASIGAIRAAECWPAGMEGVGAIYTLYRLRVLRDDEEVAVATDPDDGFAPLSVPLVNVRYAVLKALRRGLLPPDRARSVLAAAKGMHFPERQWRTIFGEAGVTPSRALDDLCAQTDVKRADAQRALNHLHARSEQPPRPASARREPAPGTRYRGHDPWVGHDPEKAREQLTRWLTTTGRYHRYTEDPADLWAVLQTAGAVECELMRWYANQSLQAATTHP